MLNIPFKYYTYLFTVYILLLLLLFQSSTIGLVTLNEMKAKQEDVVKEREKELARKKKEQEKLLRKEIEAKQAKKKEQRDKVILTTGNDKLN